MDQEDQILDFLDGTLDAAGIREVEARIASDPEFAAEVERYRQVYADMETYQDFQHRKQEVEAVAREVETELAAEAEAEADIPADSPADDQSGDDQPEVKTLGRRPRTWWAIAAAVVMLAAVTYLLLPRYDAKYYQGEYPGLIADPGSLRGDYFDMAAFRFAVDAYQRKDYGLCVQILEPQKTHPSKNVLLGSAYLMDDQPAAAVRTLEPVLSDSTHLEYARWLLALANLHLGEEAQAEIYLNEIVADPVRRYKKTEAQDILTQLGRFWR